MRVNASSATYSLSSGFSPVKAGPPLPLNCNPRKATSHQLYPLPGFPRALHTRGCLTVVAHPVPCSWTQQQLIPSSPEACREPELCSWMRNNLLSAPVPCSCCSYTWLPGAGWPQGCLPALPGSITLQFGWTLKWLEVARQSEEGKIQIFCSNPALTLGLYLQHSVPSPGSQRAVLGQKSQHRVETCSVQMGSDRHSALSYASAQDKAFLES